VCYEEDRCLVETAKSIVHRIGTTGDPSDHFVDVTDFDERAVDHIPVGQRICKLDIGD